MAMGFSRVPLLRRFPVSSPALPYSSSPKLNRKINIYASLCTTEESTSLIQPTPSRTRWKPMCLYFTQGKCTKMDEPMHIDKFNHNCSLELMQHASGPKNSRQQELEYFLVLDLEGKVEILEFPVLLFDAKTMDVVDLFHRFVRPTKMHEERINQYIEGKYGKLGVDRVWHDTAIPFAEVIEQFEVWLGERQLWRNELGGCLNNAAFVTCGNWDLKTKVPQQCTVAGMKLPPYFMEWINLKDVFLNFYKRRAPGMLSMMRELQIPLLGSHHLGIDDTNNIARLRFLYSPKHHTDPCGPTPAKTEKVRTLLLYTSAPVFVVLVFITAKLREISAKKLAKIEDILKNEINEANETLIKAVFHEAKR
ncbi:hypothetical protein HAX54_005892 [Datura stramonium]|uniref:Exonuclease domain-containing protein n=1 Tax=Datura stramonium TaxID=4076 RepID=A0ABS8TAU2_DATST|nr:hypothetical protein [Datura stramonium]